jgi:hypothetical protein
MSDRDILIVDNDVDVLRSRSRVLEHEGWSVASYTFDKLRALSAKGALFVQHLKLEASITRDRRGTLRTLLQSFRPRMDYEQELLANRELANLSQLVASGQRGALLAADILFVAVRNFGVLWLARRKRYHFAYEEILKALCEERVLDPAAVTPLTKLRFLKCLYRDGGRESAGHAMRILNAAMETLPGQDFPNSAIRVVPSAILSSEPPASHASAYLVLRDLERRLLALETLRGQSPSTELAALSRWIANPRAYSAFSASMAPVLRLEIDRYAAAVISQGPDRDSQIVSGDQRS